jgi:hypothetical protein
VWHRYARAFAAHFEFKLFLRTLAACAVLENPVDASSMSRSSVHDVSGSVPFQFFGERGWVCGCERREIARDVCAVAAVVGRRVVPNVPR